MTWGMQLNPDRRWWQLWRPRWSLKRWREGQWPEFLVHGIHI